MFQPDTTRCRGCVYFQGQYDENCCCHYIFIENKRRPCPPGKDCTVFQPRLIPRRLRQDHRADYIRRRAERREIARRTRYGQEI